MTSDAEGLRAQVADRYVSVHAFCRAHPELKRATVYLVLSGRYPGNWNEQATKIRTALTGAVVSEKAVPPAPGSTREIVVETLQKIRCAHCRRLDRRECMACQEQTGREGRELFTQLFQGE